MNTKVLTKLDVPLSQSKRLARKTNNKVPQPISAEGERLFSRRALAARHGVSVETIKRRERAGLIKAIRFNQRLIRYRLTDILAFEAEAAGGGTQ